MLSFRHRVKKLAIITDSRFRRDWYNTHGTMKRLLLPLAILLALMMTGCATQSTYREGTYFDASQVKQIVKGETTAKDLRRLFGEPSEKKNYSENREVWTYAYSSVVKEIKNYLVSVSSKSKPGESRNLVIVLRDEVVTDFSLLEMNVPLVDFDIPLEFHGFSVRPPQSPEWFILTKLGASVTFSRWTGDENHTIVAFVALSPRQAVPIKTLDDLERLARDEIRKWTKYPRLKNAKLEKRLLKVHNQDAIELSVTVTDVDVPHTPGMEFSMRIRHIFVPHPNSPESQIVHIGYSETLPSGKGFININKEIEPFLTSLRFSDGIKSR